MSDGEIVVHEVESEFLGGASKIEVLLPDDHDPAAIYPVLYVLPVNAGVQGPWGHAMTEARRTGVANRHAVICVAPGFDRMPWYADHPRDSTMRHESHLLRVVVPYIDRCYPTGSDSLGRWLVGFSKSGWGAYSLLLRHPEVFARAASWDAPLHKDAPDEWDMPEMFASQANFENYQITALLERRAGELSRGPCRLALLGHDLYRAETERLHRRMTELSIPHAYRNHERSEHDWHGGWFAPAVERLVSMAARPGP